MLRDIGFAKGKRGAAILVMALVLGASSRLPLEAQNRSGISGVVKNASGEPVEGAFVRVRSAETRLTFMVVSQAQGRYSTPNLLPGKYTVEGIGGGYQGNPAGPVEISSGRQASMDVVLSVARKVTPPRKRLKQADYAAVMPDGPAKQLILTKCVACHDLDGVYIKTGVCFVQNGYFGL